LERWLSGLRQRFAK